MLLHIGAAAVIAAVTCVARLTHHMNESALLTMGQRLTLLFQCFMSVAHAHRPALALKPPPPSPSPSRDRPHLLYNWLNSPSLLVAAATATEG